MISSGDTANTRTEVLSSIISANTNTDVGLQSNFFGDTTNSFDSNGYNLIGNGNATGAFDPTNLGDQIGVTDPKLGALADNGGPTMTHKLLTDSTAINKVPQGTNGCGTTFTQDQRGVGRPQGSACDIGAFELDTTPPSVTIDQASDQDDPTSTSPIHFTAVFSEPVEGFTDSDVALTGTAGANKAVVSGGPTTFDIAVSGMSADGTVIASIPASAAQDTALNFNTDSASEDNMVDFNANSAPTAVDDGPYTTYEDQRLDIPPFGLVGNDSDPDGDPLRFHEFVTDPSHFGTSEANYDINGFPVTIGPPESNYYGPDSFTYTVEDASGLISNEATVKIEVLAVNDAPSFTKGTDQTVNEDAGAQTVNGWATAISAGPNNESGQNVSFEVTDNSNPSLFTSGGKPAISSDGTLTYTPAENASGSATVSVNATDDGGTANGGQDASAVQTFKITVVSVNDAPTIDVVGGSQSTCLSNTRARTTLKLTDVDSSAAKLTLSATNSSNPNLVPITNVTFAGSTDTRTATISTLSGRTGSSTLTITVSEDGQAVGSVPVTVQVGGNGRDTLTGTSEANILLGQNGDDTLIGDAKSDVLCGANGNDRLTGGLGGDHFGGGSGTDTATDFTATQGDTSVGIP